MSRPLVLLIAVLSLAVLSAAPASASDTTLRATVISAGKQRERAAERLDVPGGTRVPHFAAKYRAAMRKLDGIFARYGRRIEAERWSTGAGRKARTLLLRSTDYSRKAYALITEMVLRGGEPRQRDMARLERLDYHAVRDHQRAYVLLQIELPLPSDDQSAVVAPDGENPPAGR